MIFTFTVEPKTRGRINWKQYFNDFNNKDEIVADIIERNEIYFYIGRDWQKAGKFQSTGQDPTGRIVVGKRFTNRIGTLILVATDTFGAISKRRLFIGEGYKLSFQTDILILLKNELFVPELLTEKLNDLQEKFEDVAEPHFEVDWMYNQVINSEANYDFELDESEITLPLVINTAGWYFFKFDELISSEVFTIENLENRFR